VVAGVPRLSKQGYVASFGRQWNRYDVARPAADLAVFRAKTGMEPADFRGRLVLDAGCGGGRYSRLLAEAGVHVVGVDLSDAVDKAAALCAEFPCARIVQGDLLELPLRDSLFDAAFSIGVLHHTPDPRRAFARLASKVKPGGLLAVWLYRRNTWPQEGVNTALRAVTRRMPPRILEPFCAGLGVLGGVPVVNKLLNKVVSFSSHPDWTLRVCDNYDWYAARYQSHHTLSELRQWFEQEGFIDLVELAPLKRGNLYGWAYRHDLIPGSGVNILGRKRERAPAAAGSVTRNDAELQNA
jgi:SAM-dependent methyltransferase